MCMAQLLSGGGGIMAGMGSAASVGTIGGGGMQYQSTIAAAQYQHDTARANALLARYQGEDAARRGEIEIDAINRMATQAAGAGRSGYAASGIALGSGTPLSWEADVAAAAAQDVELSRYNTELAQWGFSLQRQSYLTQGRYAMWAGRQQAYASILGSFNSALGQGSSVGLAMMRR